MKRCLILLTALLLAVFISGCNGTDDGNDIAEPLNGTPENGSDEPGDVSDDADTGSGVGISSANGALEQFAQLAFEMDAGGYTTTRERAIEQFGMPRREDGNLLEFEVAEDFGVMAVLRDDEVAVIFISPIPDLFIDESLEPDFELLNYYSENPEGLTLDYFRELLGTPGFLQSYGDGVFSYLWRSSAFTLWVDVRGNNEVEWVVFEEYFDVAWGDEPIEQSLLTLPDDVMEAIYELTREMQDNNGQVSEERAKEIIGLDYTMSEQFLIFPIVTDVEFFVIVEDDGMVEFAFLSLPMHYYLNESLDIDIGELVDLVDSAEGMSLDEFEDSIGSTGTLWQYTFNEFTYIWITSDITVIIVVDQDNVIFEAIVEHFVG